MFIEQPPALFQLFFKGAIFRVKKLPKVVYLTFDDGPCPNTTPRILELLDEFGIKATFFCVGENVQRYKQLFNEIKSRGHAVGNHTMSHANGYNCTVKEYVHLVDEADKLIQSKLFRPPYGRIKLSQFRQLRQRYTVVLWDVITRDYNSKLRPSKIVSIVKHYTRNGSVIVFHDSLKSQKNVFAALPQVIQYLQSQGYQFELISPTE